MKYVASLGILAKKFKPDKNLKNCIDWTDIFDRQICWNDSYIQGIIIFIVTFGKNIPIVGLASYPSSGNTWIRYLVECAAGIFSGSMYNDVMLRY